MFIGIAIGCGCIVTIGISFMLLELTDDGEA